MTTKKLLAAWRERGYQEAMDGKGPEGAPSKSDLRRVYYEGRRSALKAIEQGDGNASSMSSRRPPIG